MSDPIDDLASLERSYALYLAHGHHIATLTTEALLRLIRRCRAAEAEVVKLHSRALTCCWCWAPQRDLTALKYHTATCPAHPAVIEAARLQQIINDLADRVANQSELLTRRAMQAAFARE